MQLPDMNLLVALDALLDEGSVVGAARRMNLSPAAMSRTLTRVREALGDPILVRAGRGLVPTPKALELRAQVSRVLFEGGRAVGVPGVVPMLALAHRQHDAPQSQAGNWSQGFVLRLQSGFTGGPLGFGAGHICARKAFGIDAAVSDAVGTQEGSDLALRNGEEKFGIAAIRYGAKTVHAQHAATGIDQRTTAISAADGSGVEQGFKPLGGTTGGDIAARFNRCLRPHHII